MQFFLHITFYLCCRCNNGYRRILFGEKNNFYIPRKILINHYNYYNYILKHYNFLLLINHPHEIFATILTLFKLILGTHPVLYSLKIAIHELETYFFEI